MVAKKYSDNYVSVVFVLGVVFGFMLGLATGHGIWSHPTEGKTTRQNNITWTTIPFVPIPQVPRLPDNKVPFTSLKVGVFVYRVEWTTQDFLCGTTSSEGCTDYNSRKITIEKYESAMSTRATVLHELMHAVAANYQNPYEPKPLSGEEWAQTSPIFLEVLRENPKLAKFLLESD
jgi:hypothetical protein